MVNHHCLFSGESGKNMFWKCEMLFVVFFVPDTTFVVFVFRTTLPTLFFIRKQDMLKHHCFYYEKQDMLNHHCLFSGESGKKQVWKVWNVIYGFLFQIQLVFMFVFRTTLPTLFLIGKQDMLNRHWLFSGESDKNKFRIWWKQFWFVPSWLPHAFWQRLPFFQCCVFWVIVVISA